MELFREFWWLLFPLTWFVFAGWDRWLHYRRSRDVFETLKTYAAQGKEPPAELTQALNGTGPYAAPHGGYDYAPRRYRYWRWSPWRQVITFGAMAGGFAYAAQYWAEDTHTAQAFSIVAVVFAAIAAGSLMLALATSFGERAPK